MKPNIPFPPPAFFSSRFYSVYTGLDGEIGFVIPVADRQGLFIIGLGTKLAGLRWNLNETTYNVVGLATVDTGKTGNRWNDAKADNGGHLWAGK